MSCEVAALPFQAHANYGTWAMRVGHLIRKHKKYVFYISIICIEEIKKKNLLDFGD